MKNINIIVIALFTLIIGCNKETDILSDFADAVWLLPKDANNQYIKMKSINDYMSFADLSQGYITHQWSYADSSGIIQLEGEIDRHEEDYFKFAKSEQDTVSEDKTVHLLFTKPGNQGIRLYNEFTKYVEYQGTDTFPAIFNEEKKLWIIDTTFMIKVYDSIQPAVKVYYNDQLIVDLTADATIDINDSASWPVQEIEAGESIQFVDNTVLGEPTGRYWNFEGGTPESSSGQTINASYFQLGDYKTTINVNRNGNNSQGQQIPSASKLTYLPLIVHVKPSTAPFMISGTPKELEDETIQITLNGEVAPFENEEENFTVTINNEDAGVINKVIDVASAKVNEDVKFYIDLTLTEPIYNTDEITVSWSGRTIKSIDERTLGDFTDQNVRMHIVDLTADKDIYGFESGTLGDNWVLGSANEGSIEISSERKASGNYSLKVQSGSEAKTWALFSSPSDLAFEEGKYYEITYMYYRESESNNFHHNMFWFNPNGPGGTWHDSNKVLDEWAKFSWIKDKGNGEPYYWDSANSIRRLDWRMANHDTNPGKATMYFDDFSIKEYEVRPTE
ncbi:PKD domain-containing protein [Saccharicrinis aurantiacus]|uniref:PKD domain-containing protein n=1 Tax=Saccharicrinis aurantiacus TaxID=1849719 RepID=UPI0008383C71|nr:PKD domain-containing protein [Saccharicrinis aurantiacus]